MNCELVVVVSTWILSNGVYFGLLFQHEQGSDNLSASMYFFVLVVRNVIVVIASIVVPVLTSHKGDLVPYGETRECVESVELALSTELPYQFFSEFILNTAGTPGINVLTLYTQIKLYEACPEGPERQQELFGLANSINSDFILPNAPLAIPDIPPQVRTVISRKFQDLAPNLNKHLFDSLYGVIINKLQDYFEQFKKSEEYKQLLQALRINEIIFERLSRAGLI